MIEGFEKALAKCHCKRCDKEIVKDEPRGFERHPKYGGKMYYCWKCTEEIMKETIKDTKEALKRFDKLVEENKDIIMVSNL